MVQTLIPETIDPAIDSPVYPGSTVFPAADIESDEPELESSLHLHQIFLPKNWV